MLGLVWSVLVVVVGALVGGALGAWMGGGDIGCGAVRVKVRVPPGLLPVEAGPKVVGQAWEGRLGVLARHKVARSFSALATPPTTLPSHPPTPPTPNPTRLAPTRLVYGPSPCGELARGWGSLIYPLTTHSGHFHSPPPLPTSPSSRVPLWQLGSTSTAIFEPEGG